MTNNEYILICMIRKVNAAYQAKGLSTSKLFSSLAEPIGRLVGCADLAEHGFELNDCESATETITEITDRVLGGRA